MGYYGKTETTCIEKGKYKTRANENRLFPIYLEDL